MNTYDEFDVILNEETGFLDRLLEYFSVDSIAFFGLCIAMALFCLALLVFV